MMVVCVVARNKCGSTRVHIVTVVLVEAGMSLWPLPYLEEGATRDLQAGTHVPAQGGGAEDTACTVVRCMIYVLYMDAEMCLKAQWRAMLVPPDYMLRMMVGVPVSSGDGDNYHGVAAASSSRLGESRRVA